MILTNRTIQFAGLAALAAVLAVPSARAGYTFTSFDGLNANGVTTINAINNNGDVVGFSTNGAVQTNFIRTSNGTFVDLTNTLNDPAAMANGINNARDVVGVSGAGNAFLIQGGQLSTLPQANPGNTGTEVGFGINDKGLIVGQFAETSSATTPGFIDNGGTFTILRLAGAPTTANFVNAQAIDNNGLVAGFYSADNFHAHGFLFDSKTQSFAYLADPNVPNFVFSQVLGVNDLGIAVGYYQNTDGGQHGFLYNMTTKQYSFLDDPSAPAVSTSITQITGINDGNEITGFYVDANGVQRGFVAAVPEPGTIALLGIGLAVSFGSSARRRLRSTRSAA